MSEPFPVPSFKLSVDQVEFKCLRCKAGYSAIWGRRKQQRHAREDSKEFPMATELGRPDKTHRDFLGPQAPAEKSGWGVRIQMESKQRTETQAHSRQEHGPRVPGDEHITKCYAGQCSCPHFWGLFNHTSCVSLDSGCKVSGLALETLHTGN